MLATLEPGVYEAAGAVAAFLAVGTLFGYVAWAVADFFNPGRFHERVWMKLGSMWTGFAVTVLIVCQWLGVDWHRR